MSLDQFWPLFGLRIRTPRLPLRPPTDADAAELLTVAKAGIHDPSTMPFGVPWTDSSSPEFERNGLQYGWRCRADFGPQRWVLGLAVVHEGQLIGVQELSATDFPLVRSAETGSWLGLRHQGLGFGKEMRRAVLHFAFECLEAEAVVSVAFADNPASQRVSLATGYEPNGTQFVERRGSRAEQLRFVITRQRWLAVREPSRSSSEFEVTGFEACRSLFGL